MVTRHYRGTHKTSESLQTGISAHMCSLKIPWGGGDMECVNEKILAVVATVNAMQWPYSTLNT